MADAVISIVAESVAAIIEDQISYQVNLVRGVEKKVRNLSDKLETIKNVLDDAEKRGVNEQSVKNWLKKLEDIAYEMDDILDEWNYALLKHKMEDDQSIDPAVASPKQKVCFSFIPSSSCLRCKKVSVNRHTAKKIQNVKASLDEILKEKEEFSFVMSLPPTDHVPKSWRVQSTSSIELEKVYGRDIDRNKNDIVRKLMVNDDSQTLSIVGMGGIGKTSLAQLVYNDRQVEKCFELRIWICVSDPFDVVGIARGIVQSVIEESIPTNTSQLEVVMRKLRVCILEKKFLFVLDDVWTEDYTKWEPLKIILKYGAEGSKIMVTTRKEGVAKMMGTLDNNIFRPRHLTDEECWSLLCLISLSERSEAESREFEDVGKKIAIKCKGLPLAAKVLGSLLQRKRSLEEWESVLESEIWRLEKAEVDLFPHLLLSYNELSPTLKRCFLYCALYPKDFIIHVESLIGEWRALGYFGSITGKGEADVKGRNYFNNLAMRSLFQDFQRKSDDPGEQIEWCKMHDIVHDFALFLRKNDARVVEATMKTCQDCNHILVYQVQEYHSLFWDKSNPPNLCDCLTSLRVFRCERNIYGIPRGMEKLIHLRWLELSGTKLSNEDLKTICRLYFLQTLLLESCSMEEIPSEIENLVHLRHLDLCHNDLKELPESICSLVGLQILNIERCWLLNGLPEGIHRLESLQHLLIEDTVISKRFPRGLARLIGLRTLSVFHVGIGYNALGLLKNLNLLSGTLELQIHINYVRDMGYCVEDAREAELRNKRHIHTLKLEFNGFGEKEWPWMDVMEAMEPNRNLKKLRIRFFKGSRLPHWISSPVSLLKEIVLVDLSEMSSLPPMGKLLFLEALMMSGMNELEFVGREFLGLESSSPSTSSDVVAVVVAFPKLKTLRFSSFQKCPVSRS